MKLVAALLCLSLSATVAHAKGFTGTIEFTEAEKAQHLAGIAAIAKANAECLKFDLAEHKRFMRLYGVSKFYGGAIPFASAPKEEQRKQLRAAGFNPDLIEQMSSTSCVGLAMKCMGKAFEAAGQGEIWKKVRKFTRDNGVGGLPMQHALQALGWRVMYWNPDPRQNEAWDKYEHWVDPKDVGHNWGYHASNYERVMAKNRYLYNTVDDNKTMVGFGVNPPSAFTRAPMFIGTGHGGYHVFPGYLGNVIEAHSIRPITNPNIVEMRVFNPMAKGGGPDGLFRSGLIAVPPGY